MQRWGKTRAGTPRFFCSGCRTTATWERADVRKEHSKKRLITWLTGVQSKSDVARRYGVTRQALSQEFRSFFYGNLESPVPADFKADILIVDAKYIHGRALCALIAVDEYDRILWRFASSECYDTWYSFLIRVPAPCAVVADGQKGMAHFVKLWWPRTAFQYCHFHLVLLIIHYLSRNPKEEAGRAVLDLVHRLKHIATLEERDRWKLLHRIWEKQYEKVFNEKSEAGGYRHRKLRSVRFVLRRALPDLFTYLDYPGCPTTTNLVEGWVNTAIAERLGRHRGLRICQKKTLVSIILSNLKRPTREKPTRKFP